MTSSMIGIRPPDMMAGVRESKYVLYVHNLKLYSI